MYAFVHLVGSLLLISLSAEKTAAHLRSKGRLASRLDVRWIVLPRQRKKYETSYFTMIADYAINGRMSELATNRRAAFLAWMEANELNVAEVSRRSDVPSRTLYSYLRGDSQSLKGTTQERIAQAFSVPIDRLFIGHSRTKHVLGVWGKVGARADVFPSPDYSEGPMYEVPLPPSLYVEDEYAAFEIEGFSMPPAEPGWLAIFRKVDTTPDALLNSSCLIETADGRRLFKRLRRGYVPGRFNRESWDGSPLIENIEVVRALPFAALTPGRQRR